MSFNSSGEPEKVRPSICAGDTTAVFVVAASLLAFSFLLRPPAGFGQAEQAVKGTVSTTDGQPIAGAVVYGSQSKGPSKWEPTKTDSSGRFTLNSPGVVVHFQAEKFAPKTWVVQPGVSDLKVVLDPDSNSFLLPTCKPPARGVRRIPGGTLGLTFDVPMKDMEILGGKPDADYVRWVIKPKGSQSYLALWFGPYAFSSDPADELVLDSVSITERNVKTSEGEIYGKDTFGQLHNGDKWRHFWVAIKDGAEYRASANDAALLDQVVNSACKTPRHE